MNGGSCMWPSPGARDTLILAVRPRKEDGGEAPSRFLAEMSLHI